MQYAIEHKVQGKNYSSLVSLDHYNKRIRVIQYKCEGPSSLKELVLELKELAEINQFGKIIFIANEDDWEYFLSFGYTLEAIIKHFHRGLNGYVMSKFKTVDRVNSPHLIDETHLIEKIMDNPPKADQSELPTGHEVRLATKTDIVQLAKLYDEVFASYPTPLGQTEYIQKVFEVSNLFALITTNDGEIAASASAELLSEHSSAEITDCATHKNHRKKGLMTHIVRFLENELKKREYQCAFSMARAQSYGMNQVFYNLGHQYTGRVVNHCDIYGQFENMNIWVKSLR